jgi:diguanylate cyclase (GGDEF)-like protein
VEVVRTSIRTRARDEYAFVLRRERLVERIRAFACCLTVLHELMRLLGVIQTEPMLTLTLGTLGFMIVGNAISFAARRHGNESTMRVAAPFLTVVDTSLVVFVVMTLPPVFGGGDFLIFGTPIALAAMRSRLRGALAVWAVTTTVAVAGILAGRGGGLTVADQISYVVLINLVLAAIVGRIAEDLHAQFDELGLQARTDVLTGLANRRAFMDLLDRLPDGRRRQVTLLFIDLDGFKAINDTLGHEAGDELLETTARRLERLIRRGDVGARLAGDEFVALFYEVDDSEALVHRMRAALEAPTLIRGVEVTARASIGVASGLSDAANGTALLRRADAAMYAEKARRDLAAQARRVGTTDVSTSHRGDDHHTNVSTRTDG